MHPKFIQKFFKIKATASQKLQDEVDEELKTPDPNAEQAAAVLNKKEASNDSSGS